MSFYKCWKEPSPGCSLFCAAATSQTLGSPRRAGTVHQGVTGRGVPPHCPACGFASLQSGFLPCSVLAGQVSATLIECVSTVIQTCPHSAACCTPSPTPLFSHPRHTPGQAGVSPASARRGNASLIKFSNLLFSHS